MRVPRTVGSQLFRRNGRKGNQTKSSGSFRKFLSLMSYTFMSVSKHLSASPSTSRSQQGIGIHIWKWGGGEAGWAPCHDYALGTPSRSFGGGGKTDMRCERERESRRSGGVGIHTLFWQRNRGGSGKWDPKRKVERMLFPSCYVLSGCPRTVTALTIMHRSSRFSFLFFAFLVCFHIHLAGCVNRDECVLGGQGGVQHGRDQLGYYVHRG